MNLIINNPDLGLTLNVAKVKPEELRVKGNGDRNTIFYRDQKIAQGSWKLCYKILEDLVAVAAGSDHIAEKRSGETSIAELTILDQRTDDICLARYKY